MYELALYTSTHNSTHTLMCDQPATISFSHLAQATAQREIMLNGTCTWRYGVCYLLASGCTTIYVTLSIRVQVLVNIATHHRDQTRPRRPSLGIDDSDPIAAARKSDCGVALGSEDCVSPGNRSEPSLETNSESDPRLAGDIPRHFQGHGRPGYTRDIPGHFQA